MQLTILFYSIEENKLWRKIESTKMRKKNDLGKERILRRERNEKSKLIDERIFRIERNNIIKQG